MYRSTTLSSTHYASKWKIPDEHHRNELAVVNQIGYDYAIAPDSSEKEAQLLHVLECFHGYLMKYLVMIVRGTIPGAATKAGRESRMLLHTLAPRGAKGSEGSEGSKPGKSTSDSTCKMLHLAFKGRTTEDIYDTLVFCFMRAVRRYDPYHTEKVKEVCDAINGLPKEFVLEKLVDRVDFDCTGILRSLVRKGFLSSVTGKKKVVGYKRAEWPPAPKYFESGPIGFTYVLQMWFRFYLNDYITQQMDELESGDNVLANLQRSFMSFFNKESSMQVPDILLKDLQNLDRRIADLEQERVGLVNRIDNLGSVKDVDLTHVVIMPAAPNKDDHQ